MTDASQQVPAHVPGDPEASALVADRLARLAYNFDAWTWSYDAPSGAYVGERTRCGCEQRLVVIPPHLSAWVPWTVRLTVGTARAGWSASALQLVEAVREVIREMGKTMGHEHE
jgi:hypothetical protein